MAQAAGRGPPGLERSGENVALALVHGNQAAAIRWKSYGMSCRKHIRSASSAHIRINACRVKRLRRLLRHCSRHTRVIPAESYQNHLNDMDDRLREITLLQQKAMFTEGKEVAAAQGD